MQDMLTPVQNLRSSAYRSHHVRCVRKTHQRRRQICQNDVWNSRRFSYALCSWGISLRLVSYTRKPSKVSPVVEARGYKGLQEDRWVIPSFRLIWYKCISWILFGLCKINTDWNWERVFRNQILFSCGSVWLWSWSTDVHRRKSYRSRLRYHQKSK